MKKDFQWRFRYFNESIQYICDDSDFPLLRMACDVPITIVLPREPAAKLKAIFAPLNVTEVCCRLFNHIRVFRAVVPREVLAVLECRRTALDCALEGFVVAFLVTVEFMRLPESEITDITLESMGSWGTFRAGRLWVCWGW
jgi:hypothetical protein